MVRKQIFIGDDIEQALAQQSQALGISQGELARRILTEGLLGESVVRRAAWGRVRHAMDHALACSESHPLEGAPDEGRGWTRDDLYEDDDTLLAELSKA